MCIPAFALNKTNVTQTVTENEGLVVYPIVPYNQNNNNSSNDTRIDPTDVGMTKSTIAERVLNDLSKLTLSEIKDYPLSELSSNDLQYVLKGLSDADLSLILLNISTPQLIEIKSKLSSDTFTKILNKLNENDLKEVENRIPE